MKTDPFDPAHLRDSVFAVPPLARDADLEVCKTENEKIIKHLESGGVRSILYGGNAVFYHTGFREYESLVATIADAASDDTVIVPAVGPSYGLAIDQVELLREYEFPTTMLLPTDNVVDQDGLATGIRRIAEAYGKPLVLYLKFDRWLDAKLIRSLHDDGVISWIKYAVVRENPSVDNYLTEVLQAYPAERVISGIGEQPAIVHMRDFGVAGFTSGCVCVAPSQSMQMLRAIQAEDFNKAEVIREWFMPLEDLRNDISPIRVLHHAVSEAKIANTGPLLPFLSKLPSEQISAIANVVDKMVKR